jgi:hypothetical protein
MRTVYSDDIVNGQVKANALAGSVVTGSKVKNGSASDLWSIECNDAALRVP